MLRRYLFPLALAAMFAGFGASAATVPAAAAKPASAKASVSATAAKPASAKASVSATAATPAVAATPAKPVKTVARCRDAKGKFIACPKTVVAKATPVRCRDSKGKFIACAK